MENSQDESDSPPPVARPFDFLRRPMFILALLFLAWVFFGQSHMQFVPHSPGEPTHIAPPRQPSRNVQATIQTPVKPAEEDAKIAELERRLTNAEARIATLENSAAAPSKPADNSDMEAKIASLQADLDNLKQAHSSEAGDTAQVTQALQKQAADIAAVKAQLADTQTKALRHLALITEFEALKDAVARGESFTEPLKRMESLAKGDDTIQPLLVQLAPYAESGSATLSMLQDQFEADIPQVLAPAASNTFTRHLETMIRIRKVGEQQKGASDEAIIARAEAKLDRGDVKAGLNETTALSPNAAAALAAWKEKAQAFLHIREALAALQPALLQDNPVPAASDAAAKPAAAQ